MTALKPNTELTPEPGFADLGVRDEIVRALAEKGIETPFAIQELTLPLALAGEDVIGQARTGMGKTFGFGVPLLQRVTSETATRPLTGARGRWSWYRPANCACRSPATWRPRPNT